MKQAKNPTRAQKLIIAYYHLKPENWLVRSVSPEELLIEHRYTGHRRRIAAVYITEHRDKKCRRR